MAVVQRAFPTQFIAAALVAHVFSGTSAAVVTERRPFF
jgi:hypothetical protein